MVGRPCREGRVICGEFVLDFFLNQVKMTGWKPVPPMRWGHDGGTGILPVI
jgi:hypothetical protein